MPRAAAHVQRDVESDQDVGVADRLRELIDLVLGSLDEPGADGAALARRAHFSRDHLDRLLAAATGESPVALRRRLLLERAAWQLRSGGVAAADAAAAAGYASAAAFSRAFARAYGMPPGAFAASGRPVELDAPNGVHFHPPGGLLIPGGTERPAGRDLTERLVGHHLDRTRELLELAATLPAADLARPLRPGFVAVWFEGEEASAGEMAERLVFTLEVWVAAITGTAAPAPGSGPTAAALRPRGRRLRARRAADPRPRRLGRRVRRRPLRAAAVVHLRRRPRARPQLRRGPARGARLRPHRPGGVGADVGGSDRVGGGRRTSSVTAASPMSAIALTARNVSSYPCSEAASAGYARRVSAELELLDWKRRVFALYAALRAEPGRAGVDAFRAGRDELFREHPQSPLPPEQRAGYAGVPWFPLRPGRARHRRRRARRAAALRARRERGRADGVRPLRRRVVRARRPELRLDLYWLDAYGGGLFVPFGDATSGSETYGAGRYLLDTVKGADLGAGDGRLVLDFNVAYNPSCAYDPRWACPLAPPANRLPVAVRAGERAP